jgi:RNA polymerase sigma-70 factor (ECF subfamily)
VASPSDPAEREPEDRGGRFPATRWTLVERAGQTDAGSARQALAELMKLYTPALRAHLLVAVNRDEHLAEDLLQGFLADKVLEQRLIGFADPSRGRFRSFLLTALDRYVIDQRRHAAAKKRSPSMPLRDIDDHADAVSVEDTHAAFDRAWANEVVTEVVESMRKQCAETSRPDLWDVFESRYLKPATENATPEPHESIAARLGLESAQQAGNLLTTAKRMFTRLFKAVVARYAISENEAREEVAELWRIYSSKSQA